MKLEMGEDCHQQEMHFSDNTMLHRVYLFKAKQIDTHKRGPISSFNIIMNSCIKKMTVANSDG